MAIIGIFVTIAAGLLFYLLRCRRQLYYGLIELLVAFTVIGLTFYPQKGAVLLVASPSLWGSFLDKGAGLLAGIYFMVRSLDNIERGLPPKWQDKWRRRFYGGKRGRG